MHSSLHKYMCCSNCEFIDGHSIGRTHAPGKRQNATLHTPQQVPDWISYSRESTEAYRSAQRTAALSHDKMVATLTMYLPDHDVKG